MSRSNLQTTPAEFAVLRVLFKLKKGTVAEVRAGYASATDSQPAYTTVMTLLGRLEEKGLLRVDKTREPFLYRPKVKQPSVLRERIQDFVHTVFEGRKSELVLHLLEDETLSPEVAARLETVLAKHEAKAKEKTK
jgi:BlaI family transcriptional regulator, penicillinase repressor